MVLAVSLGFYASYLLYFKISNFFLQRSNERLKHRIVMLQFRIDAIKARLTGEPYANSTGEDSEKRANGKRLDVHCGPHVANASGHRASEDYINK